MEAQPGDFKTIWQLFAILKPPNTETKNGKTCFQMNNY